MKLGQSKEWFFNQISEENYEIGAGMIESRTYFFVSNCRSGKTTWAKRWVNEGKNRVVISGDSIRKALTGNRFCLSSEDFVFALYHIMAKSLLADGYTILMDDTNSSKISIQRILEIDPKAVAIMLDTPENVCIERAIATEQYDVVPAIRRISKNLQIIENEGGIQNFMIKVLEEINERRKDYPQNSYD